jgi:hypothetical protein
MSQSLENDKEFVAKINEILTQMFFYSGSILSSLFNNRQHIEYIDLYKKSFDQRNDWLLQHHRFRLQYSRNCDA